MPVDINPVPSGGAFLTSPADASRVATTDADDGADESEESWQSALKQMVAKAIQYTDGELSTERALAESYYKGEPLGNERDGRSKVVMTELRDAVLMIMPSLMRMFFNPDPAVEYMPSKLSSVEKAEQVTQFIMNVVLQQDNSGFLVFHDWFKDALVKRIGVIKYWQDDSSETRDYSLSYQSLDALTLLSQDDSINVTAVSPSKGSTPGTYDVEYTKRRDWSVTRVACIPPEEYLFTKGARTTGNHPSAPGVAQFVGHRTELTRSQLSAMGVSDEDIDEYAFTDSSLAQNSEEIERQDKKVAPTDEEALTDANRKALWVEGYPYLDINDDGVAELVCVKMLGPQFHIIGEPEPCARRPFAVLTPDPTPHQVIGQGVNDYTMDLQMLSSMIWRGMLDSLVLALQPRMGYVDGEVSLADLMNTKLGAPIRMRSLQSVQEFTHTFVGAQALPVLQAVGEVKENRVGVTKASAGLDASALQSSSAAAVSAAVTNAQQHIEMIARCFAETGVRQLMQGLLELVVENPCGKRIAKVADQYIELDPSSWDTNLDVRVNLAIGAGTVSERIAVLDAELAAMDNIFATWGPMNPIVSPKQYRDLRVKRLRLAGRVDAESFYKDVDPNWAPPAPDPSKGDPNMVIAQAEASKAAAIVNEKQIASQLETQRHQLDIERKAEDLQLKQREMELTDQRQREQIEGTLVVQVMEMNLKYKTNLTIAQLKEQMAALRPTASSREVSLTHADGHQVTVKESK